MLKKLIKPLAVTAVLASAFGGVSANADMSFMIVDGQGTVASTTPMRVTTNATTARVPVVAAALNVDCAVEGTPTEFPNDIKIWSSDGITAGTTLAWNVPGSTFDGILEMPALAPNQAAFISGVLSGGLPAGTLCEVQAH